MTAINFLLDNLGFFVEIVVFMLIYQYITSEKIKLIWYIISPSTLKVTICTYTTLSVCYVL